MFKHRVRAVYLVIIAALIGYFVYSSQTGNLYPFKLGLDLSGGTHLTYSADVSKIAPADVSSSMTALRDSVERRVNLFGVGEPLVQTQENAALSSKESAYKLIVELPGVTDAVEAAKSIGATPELDFRLATAAELNSFATTSLNIASSTEKEAAYITLFKPTGLNGGMISHAALQFNSTTNQPVVGLNFSSEGRDLFASLTKGNIGNYIGIFLDGAPISVAVVRDQILDGQAEISGSFTVNEAQTLVQNINYGALPIPIKLVSTQTIGPSLGEQAVRGGILAGVVSFAIIGLFLIIWYRLPGLMATIALAVYIVLMLALFKVGVSPAFFMLALVFLVLAFWLHWSFFLGIPVSYFLLMLVPNGLSPVTLTAAGIAGFIITIGMAVDANILIFERMKEELARGRGVWDAMHEGFARAWTSIRDSNVSSIITGLILYLFGSTSVVTGFALVFVVGVLVSMFTAITVSRLFLYAVAPGKETKLGMFLISNGFKKFKVQNAK